VPPPLSVGWASNGQRPKLKKAGKNEKEGIQKPFELNMPGMKKENATGLHSRIF